MFLVKVTRNRERDSTSVCPLGAVQVAIILPDVDDVEA
jgi:hypothetical protein